MYVPIRDGGSGFTPKGSLLAGTKQPELKLLLCGLSTIPSFSLRMRSRGSPERLYKICKRSKKKLEHSNICPYPCFAIFIIFRSSIRSV